MSGIRPALLALLLVATGQEESQYLPPYRPVSLRLDKASPRDALQELKELSRLPIDLDELLPGRPVTLDLVDQTPLQALQAICKEALLGWELEGLQDWRARAHGTGPGRVRIHWVTERWHRPLGRAFVRHYAFQATSGDWDQALQDERQTVSLLIRTAPGVRPYAVSTLKLSALTDDQGHDLLPRVQLSKEGIQRLSVYSRGANLQVRFTRPKGSVVRIGRLAGTITFRYPKAVRWVRFAPLTPPFEQVSEGMGIRFLLRGYEQKGTAHRLEMDLVSLEGQAIFKGLDRGMPFDGSEMELRTAGGESVVHQGYCGAGNDLSVRMTVDFHGKTDQAAVEFRLPWADEFVDDVVEFEL
ncbi:MAG: hypothetical protein JO332_19230, partial [Planctomycetaceae bacterium]|nr:hypothetical protein [Planctomycetaceae bacterium]